MAIDGQFEARPSRPIRVFIVDDHVLVRRGLEHLMEDEPDFVVCGEAEGLGEALRKIGEAKPDVVIVDISLKNGSGIDLIKSIKSRHPEVRVLVSSMHRESLYGERALRAGAMGYVDKQEPGDRMIEALRQVTRGQAFFSVDLVSKLVRRAGRDEPAVEESAVDTLTDRELEIFQLIGRGEPSREIAEKLHLSVKTIHTHRENIKRKLNLKDGPALRCYAAQWVLESE